MKYNFTEKQFETAKNFVSELHKSNTSNTTAVKIENIHLFKDVADNFYISYLCIFSGADGISSEVFYIKFDAEGEKEILNYGDKTAMELEKDFEQLEPITL